jgi:hypothetical protein
MLKDLVWIAEIQYKNHPDSELHISATECPDILSAIAKVYAHVRENWPYEIIALRQIKKTRLHFFSRVKRI